MDRELRELLTEILGNRPATGVPAESAVALTAAQREFKNDANRTDPKGTQGRMEAAVHELRVRMGLEK